jgi:hypothetical protein
VQIHGWLNRHCQRLQLFLCRDQMANTSTFTNMLCLPYLFNRISSACKLNRFYHKKEQYGSFAFHPFSVSVLNVPGE